MSIKKMIKHENKDIEGILERFNSTSNVRLMHVAAGLTAESGEFMDQMKKHIFQGHKLDTVNLKEEMADIMWYLAVGCDELNINFEDLRSMVLKKLNKRYEEGFSTESSKGRNLDQERDILENS